MSKIGNLPIFIGSYKTALDENFLKYNNITLIIDIGSPNDLRHDIPNLKINIYDSPYENIENFFEICYEKIENNKGNTLIHCYAGISRSVTITAYYIMKKYRVPALTSILYIKRFRKIADPNYGFYYKLHEAYKKLI